MDRKKFCCERCGKELVNGGCLSQVDNKLICIYCNHKEQPKELMKQITDLKAKLAESERKYEDRKQFCITETRSLTEIINNLLEENDQLKQQLAEERKKVVQEIREQAMLKQINIDTDYDYEMGGNDDWVICMEDLDEILKEVSDERDFI